MTHQETNRILEGNVSMARFEGRKWYGKYTIDNYGPGAFNEYPDMKYHKSWSWLMPVIEKIESMGYTFKICRRRVEIDKDGEHPPHPWILSKCDTKIQSAYQAVLSFINYTTKQSADE